MLAAFNPKGSDYWARARQPLNCLVFLTPLLLFYEIGVFWAGGEQSDSLRNGADYWMRSGLEYVGAAQAFLLPVLVVAALLVWQIAGKYPWRVTPDTFAGMAAESLLFAIVLVIAGQLQDMAFREAGAATMAVAASLDEPYALPRIIGFIGAGVYEEVLFRLCLLPICYAALRLLLLPPKPATILAVIATSVIFSSAHFIGPAADTWTLFSFSFRVLAGLFFAVLFVLRGFGVAAGCHAVYDLLVGVLLEMQINS